MTDTIRRRLLDMEETADKLSVTRQTFAKHRARLERAGFPPPALKRDELGGARWDERAIDLWLDSRMPEPLQAHAHNMAAMVTQIDTQSIAADIQQRARKIAL